MALTLTDGGSGDTDGIANGIIIDPSGPGLLTILLIQRKLAATVAG